MIASKCAATTDPNSLVPEDHPETARREQDSQAKSPAPETEIQAHVQKYRNEKRLFKARRRFQQDQYRAEVTRTQNLVSATAKSSEKKDDDFRVNVLRAKAKDTKTKAQLERRRATIIWKQDRDTRKKVRETRRKNWNTSAQMKKPTESFVLPSRHVNFTGQCSFVNYSADANYAV